MAEQRPGGDTVDDAERGQYRYLDRHAQDPEPVIAEGRWHGVIVDAPRGSGGFGYDPHFEDLATGMTGAELPRDRKHELSHRGKAMRALSAKLAEMEATA